MKEFLRSRRHLIALLLLVSLVTWFGCDEGVTPLDETRLEATSPASSDLQLAAKVQGRHTDDLMSRPGIVGTGIGQNKGGRLVFVVFVEAAQAAEHLPSHVEGLPVRVEVTGPIKALRRLPADESGRAMAVAAADPTARFARPVPFGVSTGHPDITAGTIGARVTDGSEVYALSNNHVYADENNASSGDNVLQPGPVDGGTNPDDAIGTLTDFVPIAFNGPDNTVDAAIALSSTADLGTATPTDGYGSPRSDIMEAKLGQNVMKYGRTTGLTTGTVDVISVTLNVGYDSGTARFVNQIAIKPGGFSRGGDSGSLVVVSGGADDRKPVGLLFAGGRGYTFANPIGAVLDAFGVTVDGESGGPTNDAPIVTITSPEDGASFDEGTSISFEGTANDTEDGDLTGILAWTSDLDGEIGTGGSFSATLSVGTHTITAEVTDSGGKTGSDEISVTVNDQSGGISVTGIDPSSAQAGTAVDVTITGSGFAGGATVSFENGSGPAPDVSNVTVGSSTEITATVTIKSGGPPRDRVWDVRVTNLDGSSDVLQGGFTVTP